MNEIVTIKPNVPAFSMGEVERIASAIAKSGMFGLKDPYGVLTLCLLAQAEGQHPAVVFRDYSIISGKPSKKAEAMLRDFLTAGGKVEWHTLTDKEADATFSHPAGGSARISWDHERAKKAGLGGNGMYQKYPRQMLRSRAISEGVRTVFPGATSGLYVPEEVSTFEPKGDDAPHDPVTGEIIEAIPTHEPAAREKLDGPHTSKTALKAAITKIRRDIEAAETIESVDKIKSNSRQSINQAIRDWPELIDGDPNVPEDVGLKGTIERKRQELEGSLSYQLLVSTMQGCTSGNELAAWFKDNCDVVDALDGEESREFQRLYDEKESALKLVDTASV